MLEKKKALKYLVTFILAQMLALILIVYLFDPFYQYHTAFFGLKEVLFERETQVAGSLRTFSYDSILLGSSVVENCDSEYLDTMFDCRTLKIVKGSGSTADLLFYLNEAHARQNLQYVFYGIDWAALQTPTEVTLPSRYSPSYLFTDTVLDDFTYFFNKDVLFQKIPLSLAYSFADINTKGQAYDWSDGKEFGAAKAMQDYDKPAEAAPPYDYTQDIPVIEENIALIAEEIQSHPDTEYFLFFPPYSLLMWDDVHTQGKEEMYFYMFDEIMAALLPLENATVYYFQSDKEIICNLDNYMDKMHYAPAINQHMLEGIANGECVVTKDNVLQVKQDMLDTYEYIITEGIYEYYEKQ